MKITFEPINGECHLFTYTTKAERDDWFAKMINEANYKQRFKIKNKELRIANIGSFIFESDDEAKETWITYLSSH